MTMQLGIGFFPFNDELTSVCKCRYRTARLLHTVAMRLRKHTRKLGAFQAWNKCLNHLLELARAHVEAVMLTNILEGANKCEDLDARKSIKVRLLSLKLWSLLQFFCPLNSVDVESVAVR